MSCDDQLLLEVWRGNTLSFWVFPEEPNGDPMNLSGGFTAAGTIDDIDDISSERVVLVVLTGTITAPPLTGAALTAAQEAELTDAEIATFYAVNFTAAAALTDKTVAAIDTAMDDETKSPVWQGRATNGATKRPLGEGPVVFHNDLI